MKRYSSISIENTMRALGHKYFKMGSYNLNIIGIRALNSVSDKFDDILFLSFFDEFGKQHQYYMECTTDPGKHYLYNPLNVNGCIITVPGQYLQAFELGLHGGKYLALRQVGPMDYVRDNNRDNTLDFGLMDDPSNIFRDICYTNIHKASKWSLLDYIGRYSAGCCVVRSADDFVNTLLHYCKKQIAHKKGKRFTYTLITEQDIIETISHAR